MKKNLIITLALGLFLGSCQNSGTQPEAKSGTSVKKPSSQLSQPEAKSGTSVKKVTAQLSQPGNCTSYSIFNPHGPMGTTILYSYVDCDGGMQTGSVDPQETVNVLAQPGTVGCSDCVVTETGSSPKTDPAQSKP